ncbi:MAG: GNAT family N-acetyltransferase, partial [Acidimicrobiia bacterium]
MIEFRPATGEDLPGIHRVWWAADRFEELNDNPWFGQVLRTGSMMVAMFEGWLVGFAGVRQVGRTSVVSDCFVDPEHQAQGIGTRLLSLLLAGERPVMTLASSDPNARSLYSRFGMAPQWDCHYVEGDPTRVDRGMARVLEVGLYPV